MAISKNTPLPPPEPYYVTDSEPIDSPSDSTEPTEEVPSSEPEVTPNAVITSRSTFMRTVLRLLIKSSSDSQEAAKAYAEINDITPGVGTSFTS